jgi:hypothetical protein
MDRRGFLKLLGAGVGGLALDQAIPFNRVWSFPKKIVIAQPVELLDYSRRYEIALEKYRQAYFEATMRGSALMKCYWEPAAVENFNQIELNLFNYSDAVNAS